ncbi:peptidyl-prolyl cis-trans isomerase 1-like isoform X2 [Portunus trituberculatus]|uniref:peptidyl-prolyl cis-trans isomerase 1-like isoform X2 n=1 Tax=Portunus trituberculatus TaxID=210409 RepID=UPI001E1D11BE|nr:peptidyl-prolyl cis-trans isomerase 1-like isoform X2 [Portunus trituberculatus]
MASDSDVEAYLNQLSRKTLRLKQDNQPWEDSVSSVSGADHPPDELSASLQVDTGAPKTHSYQKARPGGLLSDITALSDKYSVSKDKKSPTKDRFSTLEEKYLRKYNLNASSPKSHERSRETKERKNEGDKFSLHVTSKARTAAKYDSSEDIDDENLAHYLSEVTLTSEKLDSDKESNAAGNSEENDSSGDVLNLKNVIDVEELLGEEEDSSRSLQESPAHYSVKSDDSAGRYKSQPESKLIDKPQSKIDKVSKDEQREISGGANLFSSSKSSLFYSRQKDEEEEEEEEEEDEPQAAVRLLLPQAGGDVFHSSRRKSSLSFDAINDEKIKLLKPSKQTIKGRKKTRHKSTSEDGIPTASESQISEQVLASEEEEHALPYKSDGSEETLEPTVVSEVQDNSQVSTSASTVKSEGSRRQSISSQTRHSVTVSSKASHKKHQESHSSQDDESDRRRKSRKQSHHHHHHHHHKGRKRHKTSHRKHKESERVTKKSRKKHRSSSSSSSSSSSLSSSETLSSTSEPSRRRSHSHKHSRRRAAHGHWHGAWPCCCLHTAHANHATSPHSLPAFAGTTTSTLLSGSGLGVAEVMQQQVALVRQFLDSQQVMYQAYTSTLISSFRYTSLRRTEKYIKKRKPPLTFPEAYKLVKEEMEANER